MLVGQINEPNIYFLAEEPMLIFLEEEISTISEHVSLNVVGAQ